MPITFDYAVKYHGRFYPPNTPIEEDTPEKPAEAPQSDSEAKPTEDTQEAVEAPQKPKETRRKGKAEAGDAE